ncbi:MAG: alkylmercury lyase family protein [Cyanobacteria bacterium]|nr:alkylmercury lyase family protein [Cyanobacteriota bacterium]
MLTETDYRVRFAIYQTFAEGVNPSSAIIAPKVRIPQKAVYESFERLKTSKVIVLDPHTKEIKVAMPFSTVETPFRVLAGEHTYYGCSAWDAFGIAVMMGGDAMVQTTCADCEGPIVYRVEQKQLADAHGVAHFAVPAAHWWDNIAYTWETIRFFRSDDHVMEWSAQTETPIGEVAAIARLWQLSRHWYDNRMSPDWRKPPRESLQEMLRDHGFTGSFWSLTG